MKGFCAWRFLRQAHAFAGIAGASMFNRAVVRQAITAFVDDGQQR